MGIPIPKAALDAAEREWHNRLARQEITAPREHIRALFEAAMPYLVIVRGEVVPEETSESGTTTTNS
jgi:hypothetical protein